MIFKNCNKIKSVSIRTSQIKSKGKHWRIAVADGVGVDVAGAEAGLARLRPARQLTRGVAVVTVDAHVTQVAWGGE